MFLLDNQEKKSLRLCGSARDTQILNTLSLHSAIRINYLIINCLHLFQYAAIRRLFQQ
jgi:hypothetical protein